MTENTTECVVYWIYDDSCVDIHTTGYVGVTKDVKTRYRTHVYNKRVPENSSYKILYEGSRRDCFQYEKLLRPKKNIGWNNAVGGVNGYLCGFSHSQEAKAKMSLAWSEDRKEKLVERLKEQGKKLKGQKRPKQSIAMSGAKNPMYGTKRPQHVVDAVRRAHTGNSYTRQEIYCVGCRAKVNKTTLTKYHNKCFKKHYAEKQSVEIHELMAVNE